MKYFIFAMFFILGVPASSAQDFFVPGNAFSSAADKLNPVPRDRANYNQRRYKVVDGRVIALPDEVIPDEENIEDAEQKNDVPTPVQTTRTEEPAPIPELKAEPEPEIQKDVVAINTPEPAPVTLHEPAFLKPLPSVEDNEEDEDEQESIMFQPDAPVVQGFDNALPIYKNRYTLYVDDLKTFQKTNKLPKNKDIEDTLKKLSRAREVILFEGEVQ